MLYFCYKKEQPIVGRTKSWKGGTVAHLYSEPKLFLRASRDELQWLCSNLSPNRAQKDSEDTFLHAND